MFNKTLSDVKGLIRVSGGEEPPSLLVKNADILDIFTCRPFRGDIWIYKKWIAFVGEKEARVDNNTIVVDGDGFIAVPGYFDAHGHADLFYNPASFGDHVVTTGTTTVFSDAHDMINAIGIGGFEEILRQAEGFALKYIWGVPATYPPYPEIEGGEFYSIYDIWRLFSTYEECVSISELSPYIRILQNEDSILEKMLIARSLGKNIEGHTLGASFDRLNVLVTAGITSCHESIRERDLINRVRLGLYTMIRHSSIRSDFERLCPVAKDMPIDTVILVTDGVFASDLLGKGYMDFVIKEAIRYGIEPAHAIRMATLNPARYFRLDYHLGSIAPGRVADILLLEDLKNPTPVKVIERGRLVVEDGVLVREPTRFPLIGTNYNPYRFTNVAKDEFSVKWNRADTIPVIDIIDRTVTRRIDIAPSIDNDYIVADRKRDIMKICYTRRERKKWGKGFVRGIGADLGGIATTVAHETHGLLVMGFDDYDMAIAANKVLDIGGGVVLVDKGNVLDALSLPNGAIMSDLTIEELASRLISINRFIKEKGSRLDDPVWTLGFLTFTSIVELRITVSGVYDVRKGEIIY